MKEQKDFGDKLEEAMKVPEDLGIKIGSKEEVFWTDAKFKLENSILQYTESLLADKMHLKLALKRIAEEKAKFK